jgi:hypothetical protein
MTITEEVLGTELLYLRPTDLDVDPDAQREYRPSDAKRIADGYDPEKLGFFEVSKRDGRYYVVDGQHRRGALLLLEKDDPVPCVVTIGVDQAHDAKKFVARNIDNRRATGIDGYRVKLTAGDPETVEVQKVLDAFDLKVNYSMGENDISAVSALYTIHRRGGPELLVRTLGLIEATWGRERAGREASILRGVAYILEKKGNVLDTDSFVTKVQKDSTAGRVLGLARSQRAVTRKSMWLQVAVVLIEIYNTKRSSQRIAL